MQNIFTVDDIDAELLKKEKEQEIQRSTWDDELNSKENNPDSEFANKNNQNVPVTLSKEDSEIQKYIESERTKEEAKKRRFDIKLPDGFEEVELYDDCKSFEDNFKIGKSKKYILIEVNKNGHFTIANPESILPTSQSKCMIDIKKVEEYSSLEFIPIDYDTFWGLRIKTFMKYKSDFFSCDERVMFEILLAKYKAFDFKPFYWSKEKISEEVGIKKNRADKILNRFIELGIITKEVRKSFIKNRPMQISYYEIAPFEVIALLPKIYQERERIDIESQIRKYLLPATMKLATSKMQ